MSQRVAFGRTLDCSTVFTGDGHLISEGHSSFFKLQAPTLGCTAQKARLSNDAAIISSIPASAFMGLRYGCISQTPFRLILNTARLGDGVHTLWSAELFFRFHALQLFFSPVETSDWWLRQTPTMPTERRCSLRISTLT